VWGGTSVRGLQRGAFSGKFSTKTGWLAPGEGSLMPRVYPREALSGSIFITVVVQNFSEIGQSADEL